MRLAVRLHNNGILGAWKSKVLQTDFKVQVLKNGLHVNSNNKQKTMTSCSVYSVSSYGFIAI